MSSRFYTYSLFLYINTFSVVVLSTPTQTHWIYYLNIMRLLVFSILVVTSIQLSHAQESAQYLQNAIRDLRYMKGRQTLKVVDTTAVQAIVPDPEPTLPPTPEVVAERRIQANSVPPLSLTKGELAALYEAAVSKGETVKLNTGDNAYIHAAVHELDDSPTYVHEHKVPHTSSSSTPSTSGSGDASGYYYYYYPIKSFLDEMTSQSTSHDHHYSSPTHHHEHVRTTTERPQYQYHSHTHQHNVKITSTKEVTEKKEKKALEPLFMAISGFIGMAVMFVLSILVFPKFGIKKTRGPIKTNSVKKNERITDIARVALQAIEGKDCTERFACELEKTARAFNLQDNRFVKLLKRITPSSFGKPGKYGSKRLRCTAIPCKKKNPNNKPNSNKTSNNNKSSSNNKNSNNKKKEKANSGAQKKP